MVGPGTVDYWLDVLAHEVDVMYGGQRVRVVVYIDELEPATIVEATSWAAAENERSPALLEVSQIHTAGAATSETCATPSYSASSPFAITVSYKPMCLRSS